MTSAFCVGTRVSILARHFGRAWSVSEFGDTNARVYGSIISVVGRSKYLVRWDDGDELEHNRQALRVETDAPPPPTVDPSESEPSDVESDARDHDSNSNDTSEPDDDSDHDEAPVPQPAAVLTPHASSSQTTPTMAVGPPGSEVLWTPKGAHVTDCRTGPKECMTILQLPGGPSSPVAMFLHLFPIPMVTLAAFVNTAAVIARANGSQWTPVTAGEMMTFIGILLVGSLIECSSHRQMFSFSDDSSDSIVKPPDMSPFMKLSRFEAILQYFAVVDHNTADRSDPWWRIRSFVTAFNSNRRRTVNPSWVVVVDESMSAFRGEGMPHLSFIIRKPEPLGCELKTIADGVSGVMLRLELQEGKIPMSKKAGRRLLGATTSCTMRLVELAGISGTDRVVVGDSWFSSLKTVKALRSIGVHFLGNVKTAHAGYPKNILNANAKNLARGDHCIYSTKILVCDSNGTAVVPAAHEEVIVVGWKCGATKTMMTVIASAGTTVPATTPASVECQDIFGNASKVTYLRPSLIETYQQAAGRIDLHNRLRQGTLDLEHSWITQKWYFRITTTLLGMSTVDTYLALKFSDEPRFGSVTVKRFTNDLATALLRTGVSVHIDHHAVRASMPDHDRCSMLTYGRRPCIARESGVLYEKQIQKYCRVCQKPTSFGCRRCGLGFCSHQNTGRDCWDKHLADPSLRVSKKRKSFP